MGLGDAIQIGRSALTASQLGIQTASNNLANATTPGYSRRTISLNSVASNATRASTQIGLGVSVGSISRSVDEALLARLNLAAGDEAGAQVRADILSELEANINELTDQDLSSELSAFFSAWSELSNGSDTQALVIEQGERLAGQISRTSSDLVRQRNALDERLDAEVDRLNVLLGELGRINASITENEAGGIEANALRDERDRVVSEISGLADVTVVERETGGVDILIGSTPLVQGDRIRPVEVRREGLNERGELEVSLRLLEDGTRLPAESGSIGALLIGRDELINATIRDLDDLASSLIFEVNRLHSTGTNAAGLTSVGSTQAIAVGDRALALNDPANTSIADLPFAATNGGFDVVVTDARTGATSTTRIEIDLDGIDSAGALGTADDTSVDDIVAALNAVDGLSAQVRADGTFTVEAAAGTSFSFRDDTSGALAVLGVNGYFQGTDASDIRVESRLVDNPSQLVTGRLGDDLAFAENATALGIAGIQDVAVEGLGGRSPNGFWRDRVQSIGSQAASAISTRDSLQAVREGLQNQAFALSGVNEDEETLSLLSFQRQYQGAARVISTADELLQELLALV